MGRVHYIRLGKSLDWVQKGGVMGWLLSRDFKWDPIFGLLLDTFWTLFTFIAQSVVRLWCLDGRGGSEGLLRGGHEAGAGLQVTGSILHHSRQVEGNILVEKSDSLDWPNPKVKTPKYNNPRSLYSEEVLNEMVSGTTAIEWALL